MAAMISPEVLLRCPRRRFGRRSSVWAPPTQWITRTISEALLDTIEWKLSQIAQAGVPAAETVHRDTNSKATQRTEQR